MRILHTSDWHLGASLGNISRLDDQRARLDEICRLARDKHVDIVVVAGDIYDTFTPPAAAERMFMDAMDYLARENIMCVVIAGNHDSPERLCAPRGLAGSHGIYILGLPGEVPSGEGIIESAPNFLRVRPKGATCDCAIAALAYPSMGRLDCDQDEYANRVGDIFREAETHFSDDYVNIAVSHLFVRGGTAAGGERHIEGIGGALCIGADNMPSRAQYTALGHLHKPQTAAGGRYCGSLIQQDFGETGQSKQVLIVDIEPGGRPRVEEVPLVKGNNLARWRVNSLDEVRAMLESGLDTHAWLEINIETDSEIPEREIVDLINQCRRIAAIHQERHESGVEQERVDWTSRPREELFQAFYTQTRGHEPSRELTGLFIELIEESQQGGERDASAETDI